MARKLKTPDAVSRHHSALVTVVRELEKAAKAADAQAKTYKGYPDIHKNWADLAKEHRELAKRFRVRYGIHKRK